MTGDGTLVFADRGNHQIRQLSADGKLTTRAGGTKAGFADGASSSAMFNEPIAVAVDGKSVVYVADRNNHRIRKIDTDGAVSTVAGTGEVGFSDGAATAARFNQPYGVAVDRKGTVLYVADYLNHSIRKIDLGTGQVTTLAGNGTAGNADGDGNTARFNQPYNVRLDRQGRLWVPDQLNHSIRQITTTGKVSTIAGTGKPGNADGPATTAQFNNPTGVVALADGSAIVADRNNKLRRIAADGTVSTIAGTGEAGFADGPGLTAVFNQPLDLVVDPRSARVLVSEDKGHRIRSLTLPTSAGIRFDDVAVGSAPRDWILTKTGRGSPNWTVENDATAPSKGKVLKQSGTATYPLALKTGTALKDGFVETTFKAIGGKEDRAAGIVWRAKDANNYYVVRANALEDNVVLYKTVNSQRIELSTIKGDTYGLKAPVPPNQWHTLRVEFAEARFKVIYNGKQLFDVNDATFKDAGMVGLWTKADSVTVFDGFGYGEVR